jgi:hypothetical protein
MPSEGSAALLGGVVSRREARLLFWLILIVLVGVALSLFTEVFAVLATPAIILFVAWLLRADEPEVLAAVETGTVPEADRVAPDAIARAEEA